MSWQSFDSYQDDFDQDGSEEENYDDYEPEYRRAVSQAMPPGTSYVVLPEVGPECLQGHVFDLNILQDQVEALSDNIDNLNDLLDQSMFAVDDNQDARMIKQEIDNTLRQAAIVHKRLSALPPGIELEDFQPEERDLYNNISTRFFSQLNRIAEVKNRFGDQQRQKLFKTMRVLHPDLTDEEVHDKVSHALMNEDDIDSSSMFAQEMIDDRYKREEAKIALLYAREQKKELEQIEKSITQLHQMSVDLAALVQGQGEILDQMESSISAAVQDSVKGLKMLEVASKHKSMSRKKKIIIALIIGVVVGVTVLTIIGVTAGVIALCS